MRRIFCLLPILFAALASATPRVQGEFALPEGADLDKYPVFSRALTTAEEVNLGLHPIRLEKSWIGYNLYGRLRKDGRYVLETLAVGTIVLADKDGNPRYKADCGNRLVAVRACPACVAGPPFAVAPGKPWPWNRIVDDLNALGRLWWAILKNLLLPLLLLLLCFLLLLYAISWLGWNAPPNSTERPRTIPITNRTQPSDAGNSGNVVAMPSRGEPDVSSGHDSGPTPADVHETGRKRRFIAFYGSGQPGDQRKVNFDGYKRVTVAEEGDHTTIKFA